MLHVQGTQCPGGGIVSKRMRGSRICCMSGGRTPQCHVNIFSFFLLGTHESSFALLGWRVHKSPMRTYWLVDFVVRPSFSPFYRQVLNILPCPKPHNFCVWVCYCSENKTQMVGDQREHETKLTRNELNGFRAVGGRSSRADCLTADLPCMMIQI
jgi:hypothetical protein